MLTKQEKKLLLQRHDNAIKAMDAFDKALDQELSTSHSEERAKQIQTQKEYIAKFKTISKEHNALLLESGKLDKTNNALHAAYENLLHCNKLYQGEQGAIYNAQLEVGCGSYIYAMKIKRDEKKYIRLAPSLDERKGEEAFFSSDTQKNKTPLFEREKKLLLKRRQEAQAAVPGLHTFLDELIQKNKFSEKQLKVIQELRNKIQNFENTYPLVTGFNEITEYHARQYDAVVSIESAIFILNQGLSDPDYRLNTGTRQSPPFIHFVSDKQLDQINQPFVQYHYALGAAIHDPRESIKPLDTQEEADNEETETFYNLLDEDFSEALEKIQNMIVSLLKKEEEHPDSFSKAQLKQLQRLNDVWGPLKQITYFYERISDEKQENNLKVKLFASDLEEVHLELLSLATLLVAAQLDAMQADKGAAQKQPIEWAREHNIEWALNVAPSIEVIEKMLAALKKLQTQTPTKKETENRTNESGNQNDGTQPSALAPKPAVPGITTHADQKETSTQPSQLVNIQKVIDAVKAKRIDRLSRSKFVAQFLNFFGKPTRFLKKEVSKAFLEKLKSLQKDANGQEVTEISQEKMNQLLDDFSKLQKSIEVYRTKEAKEKAIAYLKAEPSSNAVLPGYDAKDLRNAGKKGSKGILKEDIREAVVRGVYDKDYAADTISVQKGVARYHKKMKKT